MQHLNARQDKTVTFSPPTSSISAMAGRSLSDSGVIGPNQILEETMAVHDTMVILEGSITVSDRHKTVMAGPGEIIAMQKGDRVTIRSHEVGALTAYVTYPHWQQP